jgi:hypothetical protein
VSHNITAQRAIPIISGGGKQMFRPNRNANSDVAYSYDQGQPSSSYDNMYQQQDISYQQQIDDNAHHHNNNSAGNQK